MSIITQQPICKHLGQVPYQETWDAMKQFTLERDADTPDELWFLQHPPVFTQGLNGRKEHELMPGDIPVIPIDRGGQITYHGPGQLVVYPLIDLKRLKLNTRDLVCQLEKAIIACLAEYNIIALGKRDAPGVYVQERKIGSLGLRIKKQRSYHGLSLNVNMNLEPFSRINPCGYQGLVMTDIQKESQLSKPIKVEEIAAKLEKHLINSLGY